MDRYGYITIRSESRHMLGMNQYQYMIGWSSHIPYALNFNIKIGSRTETSYILYVVLFIWDVYDGTPLHHPTGI
jgi:hypothetical protein